MILALSSWFAAVLILGTYLALAKNVRWLKAYLWTNLLGSGVLALMNLQHHIWQNFFLNIAYGLISVWGLWHGRPDHHERARRRLKKRAAELGCEELIPTEWKAA